MVHQLITYADICSCGVPVCTTGYRISSYSGYAYPCMYNSIVAGLPWVTTKDRILLHSILSYNTRARTSTGKVPNAYTCTLHATYWWMEVGILWDDPSNRLIPYSQNHSTPRSLDMWCRGSTVCMRVCSGTVHGTAHPHRGYRPLWRASPAHDLT